MHASPLSRTGTGVPGTCRVRERRGEWNRLLPGKRAEHTMRIDRLPFCTHSTVIGRIDFDIPLHDEGVREIAASALHKGSREVAAGNSRFGIAHNHPSSQMSIPERCERRCQGLPQKDSPPAVPEKDAT